MLVQPLAAQSVDVRVLDDSTRSPVPGAIVRLLDNSGTAVAQALASDLGRIVLRAPAPGLYRVRVDAIGFRGSVSSTKSLAAGVTLTFEMGVSLEPPMLEELVVVAENRCLSAPTGGTLAGTLWEEIKKALTSERLTRESRLEPLAVTLFERELNPRGTVLSQRMIATVLSSGQAFRTIPPEELARYGFVRSEADSESYAGPDAALMLSDPFIQTHCFRPGPRGADPLLIGLAFEPVKDRGVPDIQGVLWMDRATRELRYIEYRYTGLRGTAARSEAGGRVEYLRLRRGTWIVWNWYIRMPKIGRLISRQTGVLIGRDTLLGYLDRGGRAEPPGLQPPTPAILTGVVFDSLAGRGLAGAFVRVAGAADSAMTDSAGAFRLEVHDPGTRLVTIRHPRLGVVADRSTQEVAFRAGEVSRIEASVPALAEFVRVFCKGERLEEAVLVGQAFDEQGAGVEGLAVRAGWLAGVSGGRARYESATTRSRARGVYALCGVPAARPLTLQLIQGTKVLAEIRTTLGMGESRWMDLSPSSR